MPPTLATPTCAELAERLSSLFVGHDVVRAAIFGSFATGDPDPHSDLDLLIVQHTNRRLLDRYAEWLPRIQDNIRDRDLDLLVYTPEELEAISHRPFVQRILAQARTIYEAT